MIVEFPTRQQSVAASDAARAADWEQSVLIWILIWDRYTLGFTSPMLREDPLAQRDSQTKRNPIGFIHFGEPEEEPISYLDEYIVALEGLDDDELRVGFTSPWDPF